MSFTELKGNILACDDCTEKFGFTPVPIVHGNERSKIIQISQAPSNNVHLTKKPFNDPSGAKLKYKWYQITDDVFYNEDHFYITALSHCFPGKNAKGGDNPPPLACARKWLRKELEAVNNELFVIIGSKAAKFLFPNESFDGLVFKNNTLNDKPAIVLPHPSPLNRKWFKDHPLFEEKRLPEIREIVRKVLWEISG
ncbi:uracil-DNA glycosylase family protein [Paenibacillus doosanensis]|uniref:Uracil DNA glycosylase superfamily protein n=1 Tax=Paenibacillus konkukensis TaxID=2020716 RepID=A0ABY4RZP6_9BACL|nr:MULTISPECIES: uracil-DNA glycosylase family protein [Paenibacillus]MCS7464945.1 uracil-DNA glycosylase family protein [Paenibacillus doosanensis]UQZ87587.1 Uracil DNA glycosylase superfamily protein [Paenibacillus konkukensis]